MSGAKETVPRLVRRPGLFRRWELTEALGIRARIHLEEAGAMADGTVLWAIYDVQGSAVAAEETFPKGDWVALPGAYRASEFKLPEGNGDWRLEDIGCDVKGETVYRIHHRLRRITAVLRQGGGR